MSRAHLFTEILIFVFSCKTVGSKTSEEFSIGTN